MIEKGTIMESEAEPSSKELLKIYDTTLAEKLMQKLLPMIENCAKQTRSEKVVVAVSGGPDCRSAAQKSEKFRIIVSPIFCILQFSLHAAYRRVRGRRNTLSAVRTEYPDIRRNGENLYSDSISPQDIRHERGGRLFRYILHIRS